MLLALAAIWGSAFMFTRIALRDLEPVDADPLPDRLRRRSRSGSSCGSRDARLAALRPFVWPLALLGLVNTALAVLR